MNNEMEEKLITATKVTQYLDITLRTLDNWYRYQKETEKKPENMPSLPEYVQQGPRTPRFWKESDLPKLLAFKEWIPRGRLGVMGRTNERYWSEKLRKSTKVNLEEV